MIEYEKEMLRVGKAFRDSFAGADPNHRELRFIDADIAARKAKIDWFVGITGKDASDNVRSEKTRQIDLGFEWERQAQKLIDLGFHRELGLSEEVYLSSLPKFEPQPEDFRGRFDIPVLVETRINSSRQAELIGLDYWLKGLDISDWKDDPKGYETPNIPYTTWMQDGKKNLERRVRDVRKNLETDERGATEYDGIALFIAHPEILKDHYIDLPGTSVGPGGAPCLRRWLGKPEVDDYHVDNTRPGFGSASCGRV